MNIERLYLKNKNRTLLDIENINFENNSLHAIVGISGSSKTLFCKAITGHLSLAHDSMIYIDEKKTTRKLLNKYTNYIQSSLNVFEELTVEETLYLNISLYKNTSYTVENLLDIFDLHSCKNNKINVISQGEKKRVQIAKGIINESHIIVIDEPTSELDELCILSVLNILRTMSYKFCIICTIHNLESHIHMFDSVTVMNSGKCTFNGNSELCMKIRRENNILIPLIKNDWEFRRCNTSVKKSNVKNGGFFTLLFYFIIHQFKVYKRTTSLYTLFSIMFLNTMGIYFMFYNVNSNYYEYVAITKKSLGICSSIVSFPFLFSSILHPIRFKFFPIVAQDCLNNNRSIYPFIFADYLVISTYLTISTVFVYILSYNIFGYNIQKNFELCAITVLCIFVINNISYTIPFFFNDYYFMQGFSQALWCINMLMSGITLPVQVLGHTQQTIACFLPGYRILYYIYDDELKKYDELGIYKPSECYPKDGYFSYLLFLSFVLLFSIIEYRHYANTVSSSNLKYRKEELNPLLE